MKNRFRGKLISNKQRGKQLEINENPKQSSFPTKKGEQENATQRHTHAQLVGKFGARGTLKRCCVGGGENQFPMAYRKCISIYKNFFTPPVRGSVLKSMNK